MAIFRLILIALGIWLLVRAVKALRKAPRTRPSEKQRPPYEEDLGEIEDAEHEDIEEDSEDD
ncbi:MAG TPA: hypothetical protein EYP17_08685 [Candidatus Latescibacteria bacterium]|nr:hypothetical protein [Candidatus Latescibacterota bacterium]